MELHNYLYILFEQKIYFEGAFHQMSPVHPHSYFQYYIYND